MFRSMRRSKQQLSRQECAALLKALPRGVLSVLGDEDYPYGFPMNFIYDEASGKLYFHCAKEGHKLDGIKKHDKVSFCAYDEGYRKEGHWSLNIRSVVVFGRIAVVDDREKAAAMIRELARKYYPDEQSIEQEMEQSVGNALCLELTVEHMTGKLVNES